METQGPSPFLTYNPSITPLTPTTENPITSLPLTSYSDGSTMDVAFWIDAAMLSREAASSATSSWASNPTAKK